MTADKMLVETINLTKRYGNVTAVDNLNLQVEKGSIFGLLGPNGAGKTTTILMLLGLTEPTAGRALVAGHDATRNPIAVKSLVGYLPDNVGFYEDLSGRENLYYTASLNGLTGKEAANRISQALKRVGLEEDGHRKVGEYSRGMRQRLGIADVLVKDPELIIMDEPTLGIDPEGVRELLDLIKKLAQEDGRTILLSSHMLHQVQQICDRVGIFVKGRLIANGTIEELNQQLFDGENFVIELQAYPEDEQLIELCRKLDHVKTVKREGDLLVLESDQDIRHILVKALVSRNYQLLHLHLRGRSLDDIYRRYFQKGGYHGQHTAS